MTTDESRRVRAEMSDQRLGVRYGPGPGDTVDMFGEETSSSGSLMVYVSGGYWQELTGDISAYTGQCFCYNCCMLLLSFQQSR